MAYKLEQRVRALRPGLRRLHEDLGAFAREIGLDPPSIGFRGDDELGEIYKHGNRLILRMDPKPFREPGWLCIRIGLPMDRVYVTLNRLQNPRLIRARPGFKTQPTWFDALDWDDDLVTQIKDLIAIAHKEANPA